MRQAADETLRDAGCEPDSQLSQRLAPRPQLWRTNGCRNAVEVRSVPVGEASSPDNRRMDLLRELIGTFCSDADEIEARSLLAFCLRIGNHFLAADHEGRSRTEVMDRAADILFKRSSGHHDS